MDEEGVDPRPTWATFGLWFDKVLDEEEQQPKETDK